MQDTQATTQTLINPISGERVDEVIKERAAREKGYLTFEFMLKHLEDENEYVKLFIVDGKRILVDLERPMTQYKKPVSLNHERIHVEQTTTCSIDDTECLSCGS